MLPRCHAHETFLSCTFPPTLRAMYLRVYAVTGRGGLLSGTISVQIAAQLVVGIYFAVVDGTGPSEFLNRLFVHMLSHHSSVQPPPEMNLDVYNVCIPPDRRPAMVAFSGVSIAFGVPLPSDFQREFTFGTLMFFASRAPLWCDTADLFTFLITFITARGPRMSRSPGIPTIPDAILRDATIYFLVMAAAQLLLLVSTLFAPVDCPYHIKGLLVPLYSPLVHTQKQI